MIALSSNPGVHLGILFRSSTLIIKQINYTVDTRHLRCILVKSGDCEYLSKIDYIDIQGQN